MTTNNAINLNSVGLAYYSGTNFTSPGLTTNGVVYGTAGNSILSTALGTTGQVLIGTGAAPIFSSSLTLTNLTITNLTLVNPLPVGSGGTGSSSFIINGVVITGSTATSPLTSITLAAGQVVIGTGTSPIGNFLGAGSGITITTGAGTISISSSGSSGGGFNWTAAPSSITMVAGTGYYTTGGSTVTLTLPVASAGNVFRVAGASAGTAWAINAAGQTIDFGTATPGSVLTSTDKFDSAELLCTATGIFSVIQTQGNISIFP